MTEASAQEPMAHVSGGPSLVLLASVSAALFVLSLPAGFLLADGALPSPFASTADIVDYYRGADDAVRVTAFLQLGAAMPFAAYAATVWTRLRALGVRAAGPTIGLAGGVLSAAFLVLSALARWPLAEPPAEPGVVAALHDLSFAAGGPGSVVPLALLLAGIAVPAGVGRLLGRPVVTVGLVLAAVAALSSLTLVFEAAAWLVPVARFGGLIWLIVVGAQLPAAPPDAEIDP